jgi:hypothetical protein
MRVPVAPTDAPRVVPTPMLTTEHAHAPPGAD